MLLKTQRFFVFVEFTTSRQSVDRYHHLREIGLPQKWMKLLLVTLGLSSTGLALRGPGARATDMPRIYKFTFLSFETLACCIP
jgi:hypothetical protein